MQEVLSPTPEGEYVGAAIVQEVFNIGGTGNIAGSKCKDGIIRKGSNVRILRGDKILAESRVKTLRNFKVCVVCITAIVQYMLLFCLTIHTRISMLINLQSEVETIQTGDECGIGLLDFEDFQPGDVIESFVVK